MKPISPVGYRPGGGLVPPGGCSSRGWNATEAEAACLAEAVERYSIGFRGDEERIKTSVANAGNAAILPNDVFLFSNTQIRDRAEWNTCCGEPRWRIPEPLDLNEEVEWLQAVPLNGGGARLLPVSLCMMQYRPQGRS